MSGPERIYCNKLTGYYHERVEADDIEYIRADLYPKDNVDALVEAAFDVLNTNDTDMYKACERLGKALAAFEGVKW